MNITLPTACLTIALMTITSFAQSDQLAAAQSNTGTNSIEAPLPPVLAINLAPSVTKKTTIEEIIAEANNDSGVEHPLPLAGSWNMGELPGGYNPDYQRQLIEKGHRLLPWFYLGSPIGKQLPISYYQNAIQWMAANKLPLSFVSTQWEHILTDDPKYFKAPMDQNPNYVTASNEVQKKISPLGDTFYWRATGQRWATTATLKKIQEWYPDPPRVIFISNNEQEKAGIDDFRVEKRFPNDKLANADDTTVKESLNNLWAARYKELFVGFRNGLQSETWRQNSIFVGYNANPSFLMGYWPRWNRTELFIPGRKDPWSTVWDGTSASYYVRPDDGNSDYTVLSPQIAAMNWVFFANHARENNPQYWFELSIWNGGNTKLESYQDKDQTYSVDRYRGMIQFGAWLLRPRVLREFRFWDEKIKDSEKYFQAVLQTVDIIYQNPDLQRFWRQGRLVVNPSSTHPFNANIPKELANEPRWFLLNNSISSNRYISYTQEIPVFALALTLGERPQREWLIYAYSPLRSYQNVSVEIPDYKGVSVDTTPGGEFYLVTEDKDIKHLNIK